MNVLIKRVCPWIRSSLFTRGDIYIKYFWSICLSFPEISCSHTETLEKWIKKPDGLSKYSVKLISKYLTGRTINLSGRKLNEMRIHQKGNDFPCKLKGKRLLILAVIE